MVPSPSETSVDPVRWGVLGCADIAVRKVIPAMIGSAMSRVVAVASRSGDKAASTARRLGIPKFHGSYQELLDDPEIEAVYIPLPNHLHAEWTVAAAAAGKHVLCEKPLALSSVEARSMVEACDRAGVRLMEAFMYRLHPLWRQVRKMVSDGQIGELVAIQAFFSYRNVDPTDIRNVPAFGGGALMDIGCYAVNVARMMFGAEPSGIKGSIRRDKAFATDVLTSAILDFDGRHATFTCSTQLESDQRVHLTGTAGRILIEIPFNIPPDLPTRILLFAGGDPPAFPHVEAHEVEPGDPYRIQADAFSQSIRDGGPVPTPPIDAILNLEAMERIVSNAGGDPAPRPGNR